MKNRRWLRVICVLVACVGACGGGDSDQGGSNGDSIGPGDPNGPKGDMTELMNMSEDCKTCTEEKCGSELSVCNNSQSCVDYWDCASECLDLVNDDECIDQCQWQVVDIPPEDFQHCGPRCEDAKDWERCVAGCVGEVSPNWNRVWSLLECIIDSCDGMHCPYDDSLDDAAQ